MKCKNRNVQITKQYTKNGQESANIIFLRTQQAIISF